MLEMFYLRLALTFAALAVESGRQRDELVAALEKSLQTMRIQQAIIDRMKADADKDFKEFVVMFDQQQAQNRELAELVAYWRKQAQP